MLFCKRLEHLIIQNGASINLCILGKIHWISTFSLWIKSISSLYVQNFELRWRPSVSRHTPTATPFRCHRLNRRILTFSSTPFRLFPKTLPHPWRRSPARTLRLGLPPSWPPPHRTSPSTGTSASSRVSPSPITTSGDRAYSPGP
jgi:hypothetical protein